MQLLFLFFLQERGASKFFCRFAVSVQLYSPRRPPVDIAEVFLWMMAVLTILCASYWSAWTAREAAIEQDKLLKVCFSFYVSIPSSWIFIVVLIRFFVPLLNLNFFFSYRMLQMKSLTLNMLVLVEL